MKGHLAVAFLYFIDATNHFSSSLPAADLHSVGSSPVDLRQWAALCRFIQVAKKQQKQ
ncbi:hypothetical protein LNO81_29240 [Klebsiella variicola subsp. variicola]|nr:hypothetical protein [Klebsiella variicola subsp. variicola]